MGRIGPTRCRRSAISVANGDRINRHHQEEANVETTALRPATDFTVNRYHVDLSTQTVRFEIVACEDLDDALGGLARATKLLGNLNITDPYAIDTPLVMNLGLLSGTRVMTGLRTYFHGYSPLKKALSGMTN